MSKEIKRQLPSLSSARKAAAAWLEQSTGRAARRAFLNVLARYTMAVGVVLLSLGLSMAISSRVNFGAVTPFLLGVLAVAWFAGIGPGIVSTALSVLALDRFFVDPVGSLSASSSAALALQLGIFLVVALAASSINSRLRRALAATRAAEMAQEEIAAERGLLIGHLERAGARLRLLANAGKLVETSLDFDSTIQAIGRVVVPGLADWAAIDVIEDGICRREAQFPFNLDDGSEARGWLAMQEESALPLDPESAANRVARTGVSEIYANVDAEGQSGLGKGDYGAPPSIIPRSVMIVPMIARGSVLGAATFVSAESGRHYEAADLRLAESLAARAAMALDNSRLYSSLQREAATRNDFLAAVAHDLRNPLSAIKLRCQLLERQSIKSSSPDLTARLLEGIADIGLTASQMSHTVSLLLDMARLQMGQSLELQREPVDLVAMMKRLIQTYAELDSDHHFVLQGEDRPMRGNWDAARLESVIRNLLQNAIKYSPNGGDITIGIASMGDARGGCVDVSIRDAGMGIPAGDLPHIFERYYRAGNVSSRIQGAGIGLASVKAIVDQHQGSIAVASQEGQGTTFTIRLPLQREAAA